MDDAFPVPCVKLAVCVKYIAGPAHADPAIIHGRVVLAVINDATLFGPLALKLRSVSEGEKAKSKNNHEHDQANDKHNVKAES